MQKTFLGPLPAYRFHLLDKFSDMVSHAVLTRDGGVSKPPYESLNVRFGIGDAPEYVHRNREIIGTALGGHPAGGGKAGSHNTGSGKAPAVRIVSADQIHGHYLQMIDEEFLRYHPVHVEALGTDGLVTNFPNVALLMQVADCQAILMFDPVKRVVAALHAGWRGLTMDIGGGMIEYMQQVYGVNPANLLVGISPSLGPCCSYFTDPRKELMEDFHPYIDTKNRVDLWSYSVDQLKLSGVKAANIELARVCTQCEGSRKFFSYRRDCGAAGQRDGKATGRFGTAILLRE